MDSKPQQVLIFGSTGFIGQHITHAILDASTSFAKIGIFTSAGSVQRKAETFEAFQTKGAAIITGDIDNDQDVTKAYEGYDTVVSALGRDALIKQVDLVRLAEQSKTIRRFFPSEFGTDVEYSEASTHEEVHQTKLAVRAYFRDHVRRLEHTYVMTGPYVDGYLAMKPGIPEIGAFDAKAQQAYLMEPAGQEIGWTAMPDVGRFVVAALLHPDVSRNKALKVSSFVVSQTDILEEFERQTGKKWRVGYTSSEDLRMYESQAWKDDSPLKATCSLRRLWLRGETLYPEFDNAALGNPPATTLAEVVAQNLGKTAA